MSNQPSEPEHRRPPEPEPDFADEHTDVSFADEQRGGLDDDTETESPSGLAGMDSPRSRGERSRRDQLRPDSSA